MDGWVRERALGGGHGVMRPEGVCRNDKGCYGAKGERRARRWVGGVGFRLTRSPGTYNGAPKEKKRKVQAVVGSLRWRCVLLARTAAGILARLSANSPAVISDLDPISSSLEPLGALKQTSGNRRKKRSEFISRKTFWRPLRVPNIGARIR